jgi:hypothetical protein
MHRHFVLTLFALGILGVRLEGQHVVAQDSGTVAVHAVDAPLGSLLRQLATLLDAVTLRIDPGADAQLVSVDLDGLSPLAAMGEVLKRAGVDFVLMGGANGEPARVLAATFEFSERASADGADRRAPVSATPPIEDHQSEIVSAAEANEAAAQTDRAVAAITDALTAPALPRTAGRAIALPFPDAAGESVVQTVSPGSSSVVPFPTGSAVPAAATSPRASPPSPSNPSFRALDEALAPRPQPGRQ